MSETRPSDLPEAIQLRPDTSPLRRALVGGLLVGIYAAFRYSRLTDDAGEFYRWMWIALWAFAALTLITGSARLLRRDSHAVVVRIDGRGLHDARRAPQPLPWSQIAGLRYRRASSLDRSDNGWILGWVNLLSYLLAGALPEGGDQIEVHVRDRRTFPSTELGASFPLEDGAVRVDLGGLDFSETAVREGLRAWQSRTGSLPG